MAFRALWTAPDVMWHLTYINYIIPHSHLKLPIAYFKTMATCICLYIFKDINKYSYEKMLSLHFEVQIFVQSLHKLDIRWPTCLLL